VSRFSVLNADCNSTIKEIDRATAKRLVREGVAEWVDNRPAVRLLRRFYPQRSHGESAVMSERVIEANAAGAPWARSLTEGWRAKP
jgi:hypothetical protein